MMRIARIHILIAAVLTAILLAGCGGAGTSASPAETVSDVSTAEPSDDEPIKQPGPEEESIPYISFYAQRQGIEEETIDLSRAALLTYNVYNDDEGSFPVQYIRTPETVRKAAEVIEGIRVTGSSDGIGSTAAGSRLSLSDENGETIIGISLQEGMIETREGRYPAEGIDAVADIPGLMDFGDWHAYYEEKNEQEIEYRENLDLTYPASIFAAEGKAANAFFEKCAAEDITRIYLFHNGRTKTIKDRGAIRNIYDTLCGVNVTGPGEYSRWNDEQWNIDLFYVDGENSFEDEISLLFYGRALKCPGDRVYALDNVTAILDSCDWEEFEAVRQKLGE